MIRTNTITINEMHNINRSAILDFIRRKGATSRPMIARELHLSLPTVIRVIDELVEEGLVTSTGEKEYSGGRRRPLLELNSKASGIIGVDLGGTEIYGAVTDLNGAVLVEKKLGNQPAPPEESYTRLAGLIHSLVESQDIAGRKILGVAIGTQGLTNHQEGVVIKDPIQNWKDYPLKLKLSQEFGVPVVIDNDVNLAALGELWFGTAQNERNMVLITIGHGIGAGVIIDGSLYRSSHHLAGEIGYFLPGREFFGQHLGYLGTLESKASLDAIAAQARELFREGGAGLDGGKSDPEAIFEAVLAEQAWARQLIDDMIEYLSIAVANVSALLDPDLIVLRSGLDNYTDLLIEPILQHVDGLVPFTPRLVASKLGYKATALGAIVEVLYDIRNFYTIRTLR